MQHHASETILTTESTAVLSPALRCTLGVSRRWRDTAYKTPQYWRDILLAPHSTAKAYLWADRARRRGLRVVVQLREVLESTDSPSDVLRCLEAIAPYCEGLSLQGQDAQLFTWFEEQVLRFSSLRGLCLSCPGHILDARMPKNSPPHTAIDWINPSILSALPSLAILQVEYPGRFSPPPLSITSLCISEGPREQSTQAHEFAHMLESLVHLQSLYLQGRGWHWQAAHHWDVAELRLPNLICLELNSLDDALRLDDDQELVCFLNALQSPLLERLRLNGITLSLGTKLAVYLNDISAKCPCLNTLFLANTGADGQGQ